MGMCRGARELPTLTSGMRITSQILREEASVHDWAPPTTGALLTIHREKV
jgi:hypothetical protein